MELVPLKMKVIQTKITKKNNQEFQVLEDPIFLKQWLLYSFIKKIPILIIIPIKGRIKRRMEPL